MSFPGSAGYPSVAHFPSVATYPSFTAFPVGWPLLTNVQKLSLPANTPVGTQVAVTDGFVVSDPNGPDNAYPSIGGLYLHVGTSGGKHSYNLLGLLDTESKIQWNGFSWVFNDIGAVGVYHSDDDVEEPWLVTTWVIDEGHTSLPTLTHPVLQQLTAPSTAQGGVFVAGGSQDGVWVDSGVYSGKHFYYRVDDLIGEHFSCNWATTAETSYPQDRWLFGNGGDGGEVYYSTSNVATPDLATNWKNASDDSPASITVTSVTQGALNAGLKIGSTFYVVNGSSNGRNKYSDVLGVATDVTWNGSAWIRDITEVATGNTAFPWDADWSLALITVVWDDVASEASWEDI